MEYDEYKAPIDRANPTCLVFMIDQSASMNGGFGRQPGKKKKDGVAEILNNILENLTISSAKDGGIYDYFYLGVIGYGACVGSILEGALAGKDLVTIGNLGQHAQIQETTTTARDPLGREVQRITRKPIWVKPYAEGNTPLGEALTLAGKWVKGFINDHPRCFPPLVINLTDGRPSVPDPRPAAKELTDLRSSDGRVLLFNVHISDQAVDPIEFPAAEEGLPSGDDGKFARFLFKLSSVLPRKYLDRARAANLNVKEQSRGYVFNADFVAVQKFLEFGTKGDTRGQNR